ncbi:MAG: glycosyltransferase [Bacteroides sp.]|nr:glycosyltransferase [Bacteroides sp.]
MYIESYNFADKVVLLSDHFKYDFLKYAHLKNDFKIRTIHNALSFQSYYDLANYDHKKKEVLIVSRLEEEPKRISLALKIWKEIEADSSLSDWKLKIVGHGKMENQYKDFVKHHNLTRVCFEGAKNPEPYYNEASIFMMTSSFEGWS